IPDGTWASAAHSLGVSLVGVAFQARDAFQAGLERAVANGADAILIRLPAAVRNMNIVSSVARRYNLPAACEVRMWPMMMTGLLAYYPDLGDEQTRAADYVDRILRGARAEELPIELPSRYMLGVNQTRAEELGLDLSPDFMAQVNEMFH